MTQGYQANMKAISETGLPDGMILHNFVPIILKCPTILFIKLNEIRKQIEPKKWCQTFIFLTRFYNVFKIIFVQFFVQFFTPDLELF